MDDIIANGEKERNANKEIDTIYASDDSEKSGYVDLWQAKNISKNVNDSVDDSNGGEITRENTDIEEGVLPQPPKRVDPVETELPAEEEVNPEHPWICQCGYDKNFLMYCSCCGRYWKNGMTAWQSEKREPDVETENSLGGKEPTSGREKILAAIPLVVVMLFLLLAGWLLFKW